mgnify:CR=1 FL=1
MDRNAPAFDQMVNAIWTTWKEDAAKTKLQLVPIAKEHFRSTLDKATSTSAFWVERTSESELEKNLWSEAHFFFFLEMGVLLGEREKQPGEATVGFYPL